MEEMDCKYKDEEGWCHWKYEGFKCIEEKCAFYLRLVSSECEHFQNGFCNKYQRFFCPGIGRCEDELEYKRELRKQEQGEKKRKKEKKKRKKKKKKNYKK